MQVDLERGRSGHYNDLEQWLLELGLVEGIHYSVNYARVPGRSDSARIGEIIFKDHNIEVMAILKWG